MPTSTGPGPSGARRRGRAGLLFVLLATAPVAPAGPSHAGTMATPVAPPDTLERLRPQVDEVVWLATPRLFGAIGGFYDDFRQLSDDEVIDLLRRARGSETEPGAMPS